MMRPRRLRWSATSAVVLFIAVTLAMTIYTLWLLRTDAIRSGLEITSLMARSFTEHLTQSIRVTELAGVNAVPSDSARPNLAQVEKDFLAVLRNAPYLRSMSLLDENGRILVSTNPANLGIVVDTRAYYPKVEGRQTVLRIGGPKFGRDFSDGNVDNPQAHDSATPNFLPATQGVLVGERMLTLLMVLNPDHFQLHMSSQLGPEAGVVEVLRLDGARLMNTVPELSLEPSDPDATPLPRFDEVESGRFEQELVGDRPVLTGFQVSAMYPLSVVTRLHRDHALRQWKIEAQTILGIVLPALIATSLLAFAYYRRHVQLEAQRAESDRLMRINAARVFTNSHEGIMMVNPEGLIIDVNDAFTRITGYSRAEVLGQNPRLLSSGLQNRSFYEDLWRDLLGQGYWSGEIWNRHKNGEVYAEMLTISAVPDTHGVTQQYVGQFSNITAIKEYQKQLENLAHFDALTNLPNRVLLADRLQQAMTQSLRRRQQLAVAFIDLDGFKAVNDTHGHKAGDQLLITVASRMRKALRDGDTLSRHGGDEFIAVLVDLTQGADSTPVLTRLLEAAAQPVVLGDKVLRVSASLGVSFFPQAEDIDADQLMRQADHAMYQAKLAGKNRFQVFDAEQDSHQREHHESLARLRLALQNNEFVLHFQPKVNLLTGAVVGAEALIRWRHPVQGMLAPGMFLPETEGNALAIDIGEWVIDQALTQIERWRAAGLELAVSVNVGARQLQQTDFFARLSALLAAHPDVDPALLELEILETSALEDVRKISRLIEACTQLGVTFALDDFGTGYSSLTYLKQLQLTLLKIDQSFVRDMLEDPDDLAILQGVIGLAAAFNRQVIAEGVESVAHGTRLMELGCQLAQGFGIARPMPGDELPQWSKNWQAQAEWAELRSDAPVRYLN